MANPSAGSLGRTTIIQRRSTPASDRLQWIEGSTKVQPCGDRSRGLCLRDAAQCQRGLAARQVTADRRARLPWQAARPERRVERREAGRDHVARDRRQRVRSCVSCRTARGFEDMIRRRCQCECPGGQSIPVIPDRRLVAVPKADCGAAPATLEPRESGGKRSVRRLHCRVDDRTNVLFVKCRQIRGATFGALFIAAASSMSCSGAGRGRRTRRARPPNARVQRGRVYGTQNRLLQ